MTPRERFIQAAALVIRQDPKLLGIPSVRNDLIHTAVSVASGSKPMPTRASYKDQDPENITAMLAALKRAVEAVRLERLRSVS